MALVAITGATGFLGSHLVEAVLTAGEDARGVVRAPERGTRRGAELVRGDLGDPGSLRAAFAGCDAVVANAALSTRKSAPWAAFEAANLDGVRNTLTAAADAGVRRVVLISTVAVYRARVGTRNGVDTPLLTDGRVPFTATMLTTNWRYSLSKARGEALAWRIAQERGLELTVLRPGPIYGPRDTKLTVMYATWMRRRLVLAPTLRMPHVHGADVARAVVGALGNPASAERAYNVTGPSASIHEVLSVWKRVTGAGPLLVPVPLPLTMSFDDREAERDLGFAARPVEAGIRDVLQHPIAAGVT